MQMKTIKEIALKSDLFYEQTTELGKIAANAIGNKHRTQINSLENIALSTLKVSDVLDYIKKQIARDEKWRVNDFGNLLKKHIETQLLEARDDICEKVTVDKNSAEAQQIYLALIREFIRQIVVNYQYTLIQEAQSNDE